MNLCEPKVGVCLGKPLVRVYAACLDAGVVSQDASGLIDVALLSGAACGYLAPASAWLCSIFTCSAVFLCKQIQAPLQVSDSSVESTESHKGVERTTWTLLGLFGQPMLTTYAYTSVYEFSVRLNVVLCTSLWYCVERHIPHLGHSERLPCCIFLVILVVTWTIFMPSMGPELRPSCTPSGTRHAPSISHADSNRVPLAAFYCNHRSSVILLHLCGFLLLFPHVGCPRLLPAPLAMHLLLQAPINNAVQHCPLTCTSIIVIAGSGTASLI